MANTIDFVRFKALLDEGQALYGNTQKGLADAIGIDPTRYNKMYGGGAYTLNVKNCLKLARILRRSPVDVLRAAGKDDIADLLDEAYGAVRYEPIPGGALGQELVTLWSEIDDEHRDTVLRVMRPMPKRLAASEEPRSDQPTSQKKVGGRTARRG